MPRRARGLGVAALLGLVAWGQPGASAGTIGIDLYGLSRHFDRQSREGYRFNEVNAGLGVDWVLLRTPSQTAFADLSIFRDSFRNPDRYVSIAWTHRLVGPLQMGAMLAVSSTRSENLGEPFMAPVPLLSYRTDRAALHILFLPPSTELSGYPSVAAFATGYPFAAARANARLASAREPGSGIGLELSAGPRLALERSNGAELALRQRRGARGWRLGVDLSALVTATQRDTFAESHVSGRRSSETYDLQLRAERTIHGPARHGAAMLAGVGPLLGYTNDDPSTGLRTWRVGVAGSLGVEWRLGSAVSLLVETGWDLVATLGRGEFGPRTRVTSVAYDRYAFASRGARIGLTVWPRGAP